MDLNTIGIGAVLGAILVAGTNLYIFVRNSNKAELKERIEKLYSPLYEYYLENMRYGSDEPYNNFLALKKIYIKNSIYASDILKELFDEVLDKESEFMELPENERAIKMDETLFRDDKDQEKDFKNMMIRIGGWIDREHDELQIYYAKGLMGRFLWRLEINNDSSYARGALPAGRSFS
jgi:hypothetical protein